MINANIILSPILGSWQGHPEQRGRSCQVKNQFTFSVVPSLLVRN